MGSPSYGNMPLTGNLRLCVVGGCGTAVTLMVGGVIGGSQFATTQITSTAILGGSPPPPVADLTSMYARSNMFTVGAITDAKFKVVHTTLSRFKLSITTASAMLPTEEFTPATRHGPGTGTSSTVQAGGIVQQVVPFAIVSSATGGLSGGLGVARMSIEFVPEPAAGFSGLAGAALVAVLGRRRHRKRAGASRPAA
jgi:hypothetical protein